MTIHLALRTDNGAVSVSRDGQAVAGPTPLADLPSLEQLQREPFQLGRRLTEALGGSALLAALDGDPDRLLLLDADSPAESIAWEFAATDDRQLVAARYGLLRLVDRPAPPAPPGILRFIALAADPVVDVRGEPREDYHLDSDTELRAVRRVLADSRRAIRAQRAAPTREALRRLLVGGPALLHLTCHGNVHDTPSGPVAELLLEDRDGGEAPLPGQDLADLASPGVLRIVLLSACRTAVDDEARLARALVRQGIPLAMGMQGNLDDRLSDDLAEAFYRTLLAGASVSEALRQARLALLEQDPAQAGLPVGYAARNAWGPLPLDDGRPEVRDLRLPGAVRLPPEVQPPRPLLGRNAHLHQLARRYSGGQRVVTIAGTGGMGKTALAGGWAERFAWRWPGGVVAVSFSAGEVDDARFRDELLRVLGFSQTDAPTADQPDQQRRAILDAARQQADELLLVLDNYESVLQGCEAEQADALAVQRLVYQLAEGGTNLLLTSREQPAGLPGERLFPDQDSLPGLQTGAAIQLFLQHSTKASTHAAEQRALAAAVAEATEGHPLAVALLAGEWDTSEVSADRFLDGWQDELATAQRVGLVGHHRTFATAFARSYDRLPAELQTRLRALSLFEFPFFAEAAALVWGLDTTDSDLAGVRDDLGRLVRLCLLDVAARFEKDNTPATYRFQPAMRQEVARRVAEVERAAHQRGYAAYGAWLANWGYGHIHRDPGLAQLVRVSLDAMAQAVEVLEGVERLWHVRWYAWILAAFGETNTAFQLLTRVLDTAAAPADPQADADGTNAINSLKYELANLCVTRGDLSRAEWLYQESLELLEQIGDRQGKAASLHQLAAIYLTRGDLSRAELLYQESLELNEQIGDRRGKAASLHELAAIYLTRGDLSRAESLYQESLELKEQIGDRKGKAVSLARLATIYMTRGDLSRAESLYQQSLELLEQIGDRKGKAVSLSQLFNVYALRGDYEGAEQWLRQAIPISEEVGDLSGVALNTVKLGQLAQVRGDREAALARYQEGLALCERVGMAPVAAQVRQLIAELGTGPAASAGDPLAAAIDEARAEAQRNDPTAAIPPAERAVQLARAAGESREALMELSVTLFNLGIYYQQADRHDEAVRALEEVVALDERTGHPDLKQDREALRSARMLAAMSTDDQTRVREFEERAEQTMAQMTPEEHAVLEQASVEQILETMAGQIREAASAALRGQVDRAALMDQLTELAEQLSADEQLGEARHDAIAYVQAIIALLNNRPIPTIPAAYKPYMPQ